MTAPLADDDTTDDGTTDGRTTVRALHPRPRTTGPRTTGPRTTESRRPGSRTPGRIAAAALTAALTATLALAAAAPATADDDDRTYAPIGDAVEGGSSAGDAASVEAGDRLDTIGLTGTPQAQRWYSVKRTVEGSTVRLTAAMPSGAPAAQHALTVEAFTGNTSCGTGNTSSAGGGQQPIVVASANAGPGDLDACTEGDVVTFSVTREVSQGTVEQTEEDLEIRVVEEPPAENAEKLPTERADLPEKEPSLGDPGDLPSGGVSFDDATSLDEGAYRGSISPGEVAVYRVDLDWGQSLDAVAQVAPLTAAQSEAFDGDDVQVSMVTYAPTRAAASASGSGTYGRINEYASPELRSTTPFVLYNGRENSFGAEGAASLAGPYYLVLAAAPAEEGSGAEGADLDVTLGVAINGKVSGAPDFGDEDAVIGPDLDDGFFGGSGWLTWALIGVGALLVVGGVAAVLVARRRAAGNTAPSYGGPAPYGQGEYGQPPYGQGQYGQSQYDAGQYDAGQHGQGQHGHPPYGHGQYGQPGQQPPEQRDPQNPPGQGW